MELFFQQLANGLALGSVYALMAIGFTLIFGVLRLLNMAHGELYMLGAYFAYAGTDLLGLPAWLVLPLAVVAIFVLSLGIERMAFKPLRGAPHFIPLVSTIAVSTIVLEAVRLSFGPYMFGVEAVLPDLRFDLSLFTVNLAQVAILAISVTMMIALQLFLRRSQWGKAIRAVSQDITVSGLLGINVDRVVGTTFALGSALGALAGILIAIYYGAVYPDMGFIALVKAFTAAILGGMGSVPGAVLGGLVLGVVESLGAAYLPSGFSDAVPYLMLFVVLLLLPGGLSGRGRDVGGGHHSAMALGAGLLERLFRNRLPALARSRFDLAAAAGTAGILAMLVVAPFAGDYALRVAFTIVVYGMMALGTNLVLGLSGQLSLCHAGFFAIGAYASAILTTDYGFSFWPALLVGVAIAVFAGFLVSLVTFRVRGYYLALVTLAFAELVRVILSHWNSFTGGMMGIRGLPPVDFFGWEFWSPLAFFYIGSGFLVLGLLLYNAVAYSAVGRALMALRDDEVAAAASGLPTQQLKILAFSLSAVFPAVGGSLLAHYYTAITPDLALAHETIAVLVIVVIGGLGSAAGALFGALLVNLLPEAFRGFGDYRLLIYGLILYLVIVYQPQGVFSIGRRVAARA